MSKIIIAALSLGGIFGYFFANDNFIQWSEPMIIVGLSFILFFVGIDMGYEGAVLRSIKRAGFKVLIFPIAAIIGTFFGSIVASLVLDLKVNEGLAVGSGFGWYTLAPFIIDPYSQELSAISFLHNVMREFFSLLIIPVVAKYIGYIETTCLPGAAAMDVCIPIIERSTSTEMVFYSFVSGTVLSTLVPVLVPLFLGL